MTKKKKTYRENNASELFRNIQSMWQMESLFEYSWQSCITTLPSIYQTNDNAFILPLINYQNN